jgi:hypothetical protein
MSDPGFKLIKYPSPYSNFTVNSQVSAISEVPGSVGWADLKKSEFLFDMKLKATNPATNAEVFYPCTFGKRGKKVGVEGLITQSQVRSASGLFFERNNVNVVNQVYNLTESRGTDDDRSLFGGSVGRNFGYSKQNLMPDTPFLVYDTPSSSNAVITASATTRNAEVPMPWSVIDPQGQMSEYPFLASGKTVYTIELVKPGDPNPVDLVEMPVNVATLDNITAVGSLIGIAAAPLVTERQASEFNNPPLVGQIIQFVGNQSTSGFLTPGIMEYVEIATVAVVGGVYSITVVGGITTATATEVVNGASMFWGSRIDIGSGLGAYKADNFTAGPFANTGVLGTATDPIVFTDFYLQNVKTNFDLCPFYVGAPIFYRAIQPTGAVATVSAIVAGGTGYVDALAVATTSPGGGTGLTVNTTTAGGAVTAVAIAAAGTGYKVGDTVTITGGGADATFTIATLTNATVQLQSYATVETVTRNGNNLELIVSQGDPMTLNNVFLDVVDVYVSFADHTDGGLLFLPSWTINRVIPRVHQLQFNNQEYSEKMKALAQGYSSFLVVENVQTFTKAAGTFVSDTLQIPGQCLAAALLSPENNGFRSSFSNATSYNYNWDNKFMFIPNDVPVGSAQNTGRTLYNYLLKKYYKSINRVLRKYDGPYLDYVANGGFLDTDSFFPMICPFVPQYQTLNFTLKSSTDMTEKRYYLVSHHTRELMMTSKGITLM